MPDRRERGGFRRREALRLLAASGGATVAGSLVVSYTAFADSGSIPCRYAFSGSPNAAVRVRNLPNNDRVQFTVTGVAGTCPCGGAATIEYAYYLLSNTGVTATSGWTPLSMADTLDQVIWPLSGGSVTVSVGVRVTCASPSGTTIRCRYVTSTLVVGASPFDNTTNLALATNNGTSPPPTGIPACNTGTITRQGASTGTLNVVGGGSALSRDVPEPQMPAEPAAPDAVTTTTTPDNAGIATTVPAPAPTTTSSSSATVDAPPNTG